MAAAYGQRSQLCDIEAKAASGHQWPALMRSWRNGVAASANINLQRKQWQWRQQNISWRHRHRSSMKSEMAISMPVWQSSFMWHREKPAASSNREMPKTA